MKIDVYNRIKKNSLPVLTDYKSDLLQHDYNDIMKSLNCSFLHFTRESGTYLLKLSVVGFPIEGEKIKYLFGTADRHHLLSQCVSLTNYNNHDSIITQYYNHITDTVILISSDTALSLAQTFTRQTISKWSEERKEGKNK